MQIWECCIIIIVIYFINVIIIIIIILTFVISIDILVQLFLPPNNL